MATPRKNYNYYNSTPYTNPMQNYPSQTNDFLPFYSNGAYTQSVGAQGKNLYRQNQQYHQSTPYQRRGNFRNNGNGARNNGGGDGCGRFKSQRNFHGNGNHGRHHKPTDTFSNYFHRSMLEDPWKDLMERHDAISRSVINEAISESHREQENFDDDTNRDISDKFDYMD